PLTPTEISGCGSRLSPETDLCCNLQTPPQRFRTKSSPDLPPEIAPAFYARSWKYHPPASASTRESEPARFRPPEAGPEQSVFFSSSLLLCADRIHSCCPIS